MKNIPLTFTLGIIICFCACGPNELNPIMILAGEWKHEKKDQFEVWELDGNSLTGYAYIMKNGAKKITETLTLHNANGEWIYTPTVPTQNEGRGIPFILNTEVDSLLSFENLEHDFPKKVQYKVLDRDRLEVRVKGEGDAGFSFIQTRQ